MAGKIIFNKISAPFAPKLIADLMIMGSIFLTEDAEASKTEKKEVMKMMKIAGWFPMPNYNIAKGIHAIGDMGLSI